MRKSKKLLSVLLTLCMLLSAVPIVALPASAAGEEFYAVLNLTAETGKVANTLSFYYDTNKDNYSDTTQYTVYSGNALPTAATKDTDWGYNSVRAKIKNVVIDESVSDYTGLTSTAYMFGWLYYAENISGCEYLDVSNVTDMNGMFYDFGYFTETNVEVPNVKNWNTSKVTNMASVFREYGYCSESISVVPDVSNWDTSSVTNMTYMFGSYAYESKSINCVPDVSRWNTSNVTNLAGMFSSYASYSTEFTAVPNVTRWNTSKVTDMSSMFASYAHYNTKTLEALNLSKWNIKALENTKHMFHYYNCSNSTGINATVYATDWTSKNTNDEIYDYCDDMFTASNLKGNTNGNWNSANTAGCFTALNIPEAVENATYSASLTLKDNIDVNFSMKDLGTGFEASKLSFKVNDTELATSDTFTYDNTKNIASGMSFSVTPEDMDKTLNIAITYDDTVIDEFSYSVRAYCNAVYKAQKAAKANNASDATYDKLADLCTAVLNYGKYAEDYANRNTAGYTASALNSGHIIDFTNVNVDTLEDTSSTETNAAASLTLGTTISINFYVTDTVTEKQVTIFNDNDEQVEAKYITVTESDKEGYNTKITVKDIYAEHLSNAYTLKVDNKKIIAYGVYNYCADVVALETDETYTETLQTLCKAIYNYGEKAAAYAA